MARSKRWIHRRGVVFRGTLRSAGDPAEVRPVLARLSLTFGWPRPLPDFIGLAIRIDDGADHVDLLLASSRPSRDPLDCTFSSVVPCVVDGETKVVRAVPSEIRSDDLAALTNGSDPCPIGYKIDGVGELRLTDRLADDPALRFRPPMTGPKLIATLRSAIYARSQRRQPAQAAEPRLEKVATTSDTH